VVIVPGADHFFAGHLEELERTVAAFLADLAVPSRP
jgi:alpha/beta superfamily hydrolase